MKGGEWAGNNFLYSYIPIFLYSYIPISYFLFPISYFLFPISYFLFPISYFLFAPASDGRQRFRFQKRHGHPNDVPGGIGPERDRNLRFRGLENRFNSAKVQRPVVKEIDRFNLFGGESRFDDRLPRGIVKGDAAFFVVLHRIFEKRDLNRANPAGAGTDFPRQLAVYRLAFERRCDFQLVAGHFCDLLHEEIVPLDDRFTPDEFSLKRFERPVGR